MCAGEDKDVLALASFMRVNIYILYMYFICIS